MTDTPRHEPDTPFELPRDELDAQLRAWHDAHADRARASKASVLAAIAQAQSRAEPKAAEPGAPHRFIAYLRSPAGSLIAAVLIVAVTLLALIIPPPPADPTHIAMRSPHADTSRTLAQPTVATEADSLADPAFVHRSVAPEIFQAPTVAQEPGDLADNASTAESAAPSEPAILAELAAIDPNHTPSQAQAAQWLNMQRWVQVCPPSPSLAAGPDELAARSRSNSPTASQQALRLALVALDVPTDPTKENSPRNETDGGERRDAAAEPQWYRYAASLNQANIDPVELNGQALALVDPNLLTSISNHSTSGPSAGQASSTDEQSESEADEDHEELARSPQRQPAQKDQISVHAKTAMPKAAASQWPIDQATAVLSSLASELDEPLLAQAADDPATLFRPEHIPLLAGQYVAAHDRQTAEQLLTVCLFAFPTNELLAQAYLLLSESDADDADLGAQLSELTVAHVRNVHDAPVKDANSDSE